jgi:hypothetical protein
MPAIAQQYREAIPLNRAVDFVPGRPNISTLWRWATKGVRGVRLGTIIVGGRRMTTPDMIETFLRALNSGEPLADELDAADLARRGREAGAALEKLGC